MIRLEPRCGEEVGFSLALSGSLEQGTALRRKGENLNLLRSLIEGCSGFDMSQGTMQLDCKTWPQQWAGKL